MMRVSIDQLCEVAYRLAVVKLNRYIATHPELQIMDEEARALYHRVFVPYAMAKLTNRLKRHDFDVVDEELPLRASSRRHLDRTLLAVSVMIKRAIARSEGRQ